nr:hypothetical protein [Tanacetum cinerariifolium]
MSSTRSMLVANGDDCLDGCVAAEGRDVNRGWVVLGVFKSSLRENLDGAIGVVGGGELDSGLTKQHARTLIQAVCLRDLLSFLSLDDFGLIMINGILEIGVPSFDEEGTSDEGIKEKENYGSYLMVESYGFKDRWSRYGFCSVVEANILCHGSIFLRVQGKQSEYEFLTYTPRKRIITAWDVMYILRFIKRLVP